MKAIIVTRGKIATVDDEDFERANQFKWHTLKSPDGQYYVQRNIYGQKPAHQLLHHFILGIKGIDHKNGDGLDNRKENLRSATDQQNSWSFQRKRPGVTSKFRGVSWDKSRRLWKSTLKINGKQKFLGRFDNEEEAARNYDAKARELFGQFATPNFPE